MKDCREEKILTVVQIQVLPIIQLNPYETATSYQIASDLSLKQVCYQYNVLKRTHGHCLAVPVRGLQIKRYFCLVYDCAGKADFSTGY